MKKILLFTSTLFMLSSAQAGIISGDVFAKGNGELDEVPGSVVVIAEFKALPGKEDELRKATLAIVEPTKKEPGSLRFSVYEVETSPGTFFILESWRSEEDLESHFKMPYIRDLVKIHKNILENPLKLHRVRRVSEAD